MPNWELKISQCIKKVADKQEKCVKQMNRKQLIKLFKEYGIKKTYMYVYIYIYIHTCGGIILEEALDLSIYRLLTMMSNGTAFPCTNNEIYPYDQFTVIVNLLEN